MIRSIIILSLLASLFLFQLQLPRIGLFPLVISMYLLFTNGAIRTETKHRDFSKYHVLFGLRILLIIGLSLLLHVFHTPIIIILYVLLGMQISGVWLMLLGKYKDEYIMFHIGYYFIFAILWRYVAVVFGRDSTIVISLLFPVVTFLLYAGGSFFIHPFVRLPIQWHYRTALFFVISFLSCIILYFFSLPLLGRSAALLLYGSIMSFALYQYTLYTEQEKKKTVYAEDILAGKKVIQPPEGVWHDVQMLFYQLLHTLSLPRRTLITRFSVLFAAGAMISAFSSTSHFPLRATGSILIINGIILYGITTYLYRMRYPTAGPDSIMGMYMHAFFIRTLWSSGIHDITTSVFVIMGRTILHHASSIFLAGQASYWHNKRKYPLLYGYSVSTSIVGLGGLYLFTQLGLEKMFIRAIVLLYLGVGGTMIYFFIRALTVGEHTSYYNT